MKVGKDKKGSPVYVYYHAVLEAKLVTVSGLALSVATEFIENTDINKDLDFEKQKQDCELKAFYRLAEKLKRSFPQLNICLVLDSLYAGKPTFDICEKYRFRYIITFKEGSMPETFKEFETLKKLSQENSAHLYKEDELSQDYKWVR